MQVERISKFQLLALIIFHEIGSTTLFARGIGAKQDAWIAIVIGMLMGFVILWVYTQIQLTYPNKNLPEILIAVLGKWVACPLALLYALSFFFTAVFNLREFTELFTITILPSTPLTVLILFVMFTSIYAVSSGIEVLARSAELALPFYLFFLLLIFTLTLASGIADFSKLKPVLENGFKPVFTNAFPSILNFPFGEMSIFLMYWKYVNSKSDFRKISFVSVGISGIFLIVSVIIMISVLGVRITTGTWIPLFEVIKLINVGDFITNLDPIGIIFILIGGFFKMTLFFYGGVLILQTLFKITHKNWLIILCAIFLSSVSILYFPNLTYHRWVGLNIHTPYIDTMFYIIIPTLILMIIWVKSKAQKEENKHANN
jgi:spore germination protein KB